MTYILFLVALVVAALVFVLMQLFGFNAKYETIFKTIGVFAAMLPVLVGAASIVFIVEVGISLIVFGVLYSAGIVQSIAHQHVIFALYGMAIIAMGIAVFNLGYAVLVGRDGKDGDT